MNEIENGTKRQFGDKQCVYYEGYWIRYYTPPKETLLEKKNLIVRLTRRAFHHTESGINTPSEKLDLARKAYEAQQDPEKKRVNGAMLAGALFNRATDIFTIVVDLQQKGVKISPTDTLMHQCGEYLHEAMELGKIVRHYSGQEGIDELWGEPIKAFTTSIQDFYISRYIKIAQAMREIDTTAKKLCQIFTRFNLFADVCSLILDFAEAAKQEAETRRRDPAMFDIWPNFVTTGENVLKFKPKSPGFRDDLIQRHLIEGMYVLRDGKNLLTYLAELRVPMPKTTQIFMDRCDQYDKKTTELVAVGPKFEALLGKEYEPEKST